MAYILIMENEMNNEQTPTTLYFTKRFLTGTLKGLSVQTHISFPADRTAYYAKAFAKGTKGKEVITSNRYVITAASFQNYAR